MRVDCPNCHGMGKQVDWVDDCFGNKEQILVPCHLCSGDGYVNYGDLDGEWVRAGADENCTCDDDNDKFYQDHGFCEYCFFMG